MTKTTVYEHKSISLILFPLTWCREQRHMLKVSSTLSYLLNDGNITQSIQKEVSMTEALDEAVEG